MPKKNSLKIYVEGGYYHLYNRGVEKRKIFLDDRDYRVFLNLFKSYLSPPRIEKDKPFPLKKISESIYKDIQLLSFCLMPNHFHLQVKQFTKKGIEKLMRRMGTNYVMYFNQRYSREGRLFQGVYKAVLVQNEPQFLHLSRYIHLNPLELVGNRLENLVKYPYSSYGYYLGKKKAEWLHSEEILSSFRSARKKELKDILSYQSFVEDYKAEFDLEDLTLE